MKEKEGKEFIIATIIDELKIDPELRDLLPPLTKEEYQKLKESLINDGFHSHKCIEIWCTPDSERYIVDGHNRYKICRDNNIEINHWTIVTVGYWDNKEEVKHWAYKAVR